tara:strand:+ start:16 stop:1659 length:1644 start_codon:yes stop_codon:yes gene_type:complete
MKNTVLATKWRPKLFSDLIGQEPVVTALVNSLDNKRLHHSYLFTGTRGVGKTTLARILAKCLNCEAKGITSNPCGECSSCISIDAGQFVDLYEVDAASRTKVEDTRELLENVQYMPTQGRYKIYLIDEVHMLSTHSFNALLKTLEEPPEHVKFVLATTDPQKIPSTILSRCLHFSLNRITPEVIKNQLEKVLENEQILYEEQATISISKIADGSMRDALSIAEQCISHGDNEITYENICKILCLMPSDSVNQLIDLLVDEDIESIMEIIDKMYYQSFDFKFLLEELISIFHQTAIYKITKSLSNNPYDSSIKKLSDKYDEDEIQILYQVGVSNLKDMEFAPNYKSGFEMAIIRMVLFTPFDIEKIISQNSSSSNNAKENNIKKENNSKENIIKKEKSIEIKKNTTSNVKSVEGKITIEKNWDVVIKRLDIDAMTKNLANNITYDSEKNNLINFLIDENLLSVVTSKSIAKLQESLSHYFKKDILINIEKSNLSLSTLQKKNENDYNNRIKVADKKIENDEFIKAIKEKFNATSIDDSIQINEQIKGE